MTVIDRFGVGRILLHILAMLGDRCVRFHVQGIQRELPSLASARALLVRGRGRMLGALAQCLAKPLERCIAGSMADPRAFAALLHRGDVLLVHGNTRAAAIIKRVTRSSWSHVSMYVGPLDDGPDPLCVVEADIVEGVRPIRLSQIKARQLCILRPTALSDGDRSSVADWVVARIGSDYDLAHAARLLGRTLRPLLPLCFRSSPRPIAGSTTRFMCCSLLAHAFAWAGHPIVVEERSSGRTVAMGANLVPGDFERVPIFESIGPSTARVTNVYGPDEMATESGRLDDYFRNAPS